MAAIVPSSSAALDHSNHRLTSSRMSLVPPVDGHEFAPDDHKLLDSVFGKLGVKAERLATLLGLAVLLDDALVAPAALQEPAAVPHFL